MNVKDFLEEFDARGEDVSRANHRFFQPSLERWFDLIDDHIITRSVVSNLESQVNFREWYEERANTATGTFGSGKLEWPSGRDQALGMQSALFRELAKNRIRPIQFASLFLGRLQNPDRMIEAINSQVFRAFERDLRRKLKDAIEAATSNDVPAADRIVTLDHNSKAYIETTKAITEVRRAVIGLNSYEDVEEKQRLIAEIVSGELLLKEKQARIAAIKETIVSALLYLLRKITDNAINLLIKGALFALGALLGISFIH